MKILLVSSALAAASLFAPAFAQEATTKAEATINQPAPPTDEFSQAKARANVTVETNVQQTPTSTVETRTETVTPVSGRPKLDPAAPISPEVQAVVSSGKKYSTEDIVLAQLEALKNTPVTEPVTTITTTTTTPVG